MSRKDRLTIKVLMNLFNEAIKHNSNRIDADMYLNDKGIKITAKITFEIEGLEAADDNHV